MAKNKPYIVNDATFVYTCIQAPVRKYEATTNDPEDMEYKVTLVLSDEEAERWDEHFGSKQQTKAVKNAKFEKEYKIDPPFDTPAQNIITLRQPCTSADGEELPEFMRPKVLVPGSKPGMVRNVTQKVLVGNGSSGKVEVYTFEARGQTFGRLQAIFVEDMIEYVREPETSFGFEEGDEDEDNSPEPDNSFGSEEEAEEEEAPAPKPKRTRRSTKKAAKVESNEDPDDDIPF